MSPEGSYKLYRKKLSEIKPPSPCIPYLYINFIVNFLKIFLEVFF